MEFPIQLLLMKVLGNRVLFSRDSAELGFSVAAVLFQKKISLELFLEKKGRFFQRINGCQ